MYIPGEVGTWALLLAEERNITTGIHTLTEAVGLLQRWFQELCSMPWIDECYDAIRDVYRLLQNAHGVVRPRPFARCIAIYERDGEYVTCGQQLYAPKPGDKIRCRSCGRRYDGFGLQALADSVGVADGGTARSDPAHVRAQ